MKHDTARLMVERSLRRSQALLSPRDAVDAVALVLERLVNTTLLESPIAAMLADLVGIALVADELELGPIEAAAGALESEPNPEVTGDDVPMADVATWALWWLWRATEQQVCRVCGCSDYRACEGRCHWVEHDLCSACVGVV